MKKHTKAIAKTYSKYPVSQLPEGSYQGNLFTENAEDLAITWGKTEEEAQANVELIRDAFNVTNDTGLTPLELKERYEKMRKALEDLICRIEPKETYNEDIWQNAKDSLTPSKGQN